MRSSEPQKQRSYCASHEDRHQRMTERTAAGQTRRTCRLASGALRRRCTAVSPSSGCRPARRAPCRQHSRTDGSAGPTGQLSGPTGQHNGPTGQPDRRVNSVDRRVNRTDGSTQRTDGSAGPTGQLSGPTGQLIGRCDGGSGEVEERQVNTSTGRCPHHPRTVSRTYVVPISASHHTI